MILETNLPSRSSVFAALVLVFGLTLTVHAADASYRGSQKDRGTVFDLTVQTVGDPAAPLREGDPALFTLGLHDETTNARRSGVFPNVWLVASAAALEPDANRRCTAQIAKMLAGGFTSPAVLDLNVYYVLALNGDGSITVTDPHFGFGGSQLLAMLELGKPGYDWALAAGDNRLFVSVPEANRVAVIDTVRWKELGSVDAGPNPRRIVAAPDGQQVWVATDAGIAVISATDGKVVRTLAAGKGEHDLAISQDGRFVVATNRTDGTATVLDARGNAVLGTVATGPTPVSLVFSSLSGMAYAAGADGTVTVIDPKRRKVLASIAARAGLTQIRMAPGGRYAFIANPTADVVQIIDTASNRVVQTGAIDEGPFDVAFTDTLAYVRRLRSETVQMIPLAAIGKEGEAVAVVDFPAGEYGFGKVPRTTAAAGLVSAPGENAVIIANPADNHVYYYKEGMAAPIGHFANASRSAQAVLVLDRSIRESRGVYTTSGILPAAGDYEVAVFVNTPRALTCFPIKVTENPAVASKRHRMPVTIEHLNTDVVIPAGSPTQLAFRLRDPATSEPRDGLDDAMVLIIQAGSTWNVRQPLRNVPGGRYETDFTPPATGVYYVYVGVPSIGLRTSNPRVLSLEAR
jgi:YVTN family beta-propeller protein